MPEPRELQNARQSLAKAESGYRSADGLAKLAEGLALLEDIIGAGSAEHAKIARNLASAYAARIYARIKRLIDTDPALPEPELEHFFEVVRAFDALGIDLPRTAHDLKIDVVRQLIERYYEGHSAEKKQEALRTLEALRRK